MANASISRNATRVNVAAALKDARIKCQNDSRWLVAVNKAALELEASAWSFDGEVLSITSRTDLHTRYTASAHGCTCHAYVNGCPCWHRAAWRLLVRAAEMREPTPPLRTALDNAAFVRLTAALNDELFG